MTKNKILVDTSIFVSFFRGSNIPEFENLLLNNRILLSPYVRLELLQGVRKPEISKLNYVLGGIEPIPHELEALNKAEDILLQIKPAGITIGIVDLIIAAEACLLGVVIFSFDHVFQKLSQLKAIPGTFLTDNV